MKEQKMNIPDQFREDPIYEGDEGQKKEHKEEHKKEHKKERRKTLIFWIIVFLLLLAILVIAPIVNDDVELKLPSLPGIDRSVTSTDQELSPDEDDPNDVAARLQDEVNNNTLNARIASALQPDANGRVYLSLKNKYEGKLLQVVIVDEETEEVYYKSPVLEPLMEIDFDTIIRPELTGEYSCIAYFYYYTMNEEPISKVGAKIKLITQ